MSEMIRKQFYIHKRHQLLLRRLAQAKGVSEAEIVRQAIEHEAAGTERQKMTPDRSAWEEIMAAVETRRALGAETEPYKWDRRDAYHEREEQFLPSAK
jgi:hypothetical protein